MFLKLPSTQDIVSLVLKLSWKDANKQEFHAFVSWTGGASNSGDIDIPQEVAACLDVVEGLKVRRRHS
jgi:hypothetical protein